MSTLRKIAIPKVGKGGAGSYHTSKLQYGRVRQSHIHRPLPQVRDSRDKEVMKRFVGYTRSKEGKVLKRNIMKYSNTIHTSTGSGGNTDCFIFVIKKL